MDVLQDLAWLAGLGLQLLLIGTLLRGAWRRFGFIFVYCVTLFLTTVAEMAAKTKGLTRLWRNLYWIDEILVQVLLFCVVVALGYRALDNAEQRARIRRWLVLGALLFAAFSFAAHHDAGHPNAWMTLVSRDLSFGSAVLDLLLWFLLIAQPKRDSTLLLLSGGLGIQFTGSAMGESVRYLAVRHVSHAIALAGNLILVTSDLLCLYVWWQTFRRDALKEEC